MTTTIIVGTSDGAYTITSTSDIADLNVERTLQNHGYDPESVSYEVQTSDVLRRLTELKDRVDVLEKS